MKEIAIAVIAFQIIISIGCIKDEENSNDGSVEKDANGTDGGADAADMDGNILDASSDAEKDGGDDSGGCKWRREFETIGYGFVGIWGLGLTDIYAAGNSQQGTGVVSHYNGEEWLEMQIVDSPPLTGIWGANGSSLYAVGFEGTILHYDGSQWVMSYQTDSEADLSDIWGSGESDIYAVDRSMRDSMTWTKGGDILHYNGNEWQVVLAHEHTSTNLWGVWGSSENDVYVVGENGTVSPANNKHYNGTDWKDGPSSSPCFDVWGSSSDDMYFICTTEASKFDIFHYDGSVMSAMNTGFDGTLQKLGGTSSDDLYAIAFVFDESGGSSTLIGTNVYHYDGNVWSSTEKNDSWFIVNLWAGMKNEAYAVGYDNDTSAGLILKYSCK